MFSQFKECPRQSIVVVVGSLIGTGGGGRKVAEVKFLVTWCSNAVVYGIMPSITGIVV